jgi:protease IV
MPVFRWLWGIVRSVLNGIARIGVFALLVAAVVLVIGMFRSDGVAGNTVLQLDLRNALEDKSSPGLLALGGEKLSLIDVVMTLDQATRDSRVKGLLVRVGSGDLPVAKGEELRDAIKRFQGAGKFVIAHSQTFYSGGLGDYTAVSSADQIWMQPISSFFGTGTSTTTLFFKGLFDKIDAAPQFVQRYEYKNAANIFSETDYTPAHREATTQVLQSWYDSATGEAAADRHMDKAAFISILEQSPSMAEFVKEKGLITNIGYEDDASDAARAKAGTGARIIDFERYRRATRGRDAGFGAPTLALIHAGGDIVEGRGSTALNAATTEIAGDTYAQAIRDAAADSSVKAIVLRIDSPGGSAIASDQILHALKKARAGGKPIVVSMGSVAASGGYYIAMAADRIVAEPGTLTGSIGVLWGKVALGRSAQLIGVNARELGVGKNATFLSAVAPWDATQLGVVNQQADAVYADFTQKVAEGRKMPLETVQQVARGRVWTGADAKTRGLVDELGGFWTAVDDAKLLSKIPPQTRVSFKLYPRPRGLFGQLSDLTDGSSAALQALNGLNAILDSTLVRSFTDVVRATRGGSMEMRAFGLPG